MRQSALLAGITLAFAATLAVAQHATAPTQPYAGQHTRAITSLSPEEIDGFLKAAGMGLAKPAELNGFPGPMHVIELAPQLGLTADQMAKTQAAMDTMKARGRELGAAYVAAEAAVDDAFRSGASHDVIAARVAQAGQLLAEIRMAHLDAHLAITPLLSPTQRVRYTGLRGYTGASPAGHTSPHPNRHHKH
jgi:hypothetical protein